MEKELSYLTPEGFTVFTSEFHKKRGTCCQSTCLHCPYGYTLKKLGIQFEAVTESDGNMIDEILQENQESVEWKSYLPDNILFLKIKGRIAGLLIKNHLVIKKLVLKTHFKDQNLSREMVESYLFI